MLSRIRNFSIIAHIDHGKSTLADRMLELTQTIEKRKMQEQVLDRMDLERERGITIKMQPVRMRYHHQGVEYVLNLIDTPGHIDFSYEVSRALKAVEGVVLVVDATQGVQAQTFTVLHQAQELGLTIIPVVNKIDLPIARADEVKGEVAELLGISTEDILAVSGKTGNGVPELLASIVEHVPPPTEEYTGPRDLRALVFDYEYGAHRGVVVYVRILDGSVRKGDQLVFMATDERFEVLEVGTFSPEPAPRDTLSAGEIGYLVTGIKKAGEARVGDTLTRFDRRLPALPGYLAPKPVVWASLYPESQDDLTVLRQALERLRLSDAALSFEEEASGTLGRGFRCGFLGMLHMEIITERLRREFSLTLVVTTPTISYEITSNTGEISMVYSPSQFPDDRTVRAVREPWVSVRIIAPPEYLGPIVTLAHEHEAVVGSTENFGSARISVEMEMPLRELMRNFFDELKSVTSGYASLSYEFMDMRPADVVRLDLLVAEEVVPAFSRVVARRRLQKEAEDAVRRLKEFLPAQLIVIKIQAFSCGRIVAAERIAALRKDVTGYLYGGDITRKMKLREKQKKGKKKMQQIGRVSIPQDVFVKMMRDRS